MLGEIVLKNFINYDRKAAVNYALEWVLGRNPKYKDYEDWGGDCTNFISQCVHAGKIPFDHEGGDILKQWYWYSDMARTPSWTAAEPFYKYIIGNNSQNTSNYGIYAKEVAYEDLEIGDIVQLIYENNLAYHNLIITDKIVQDGLFVDYLICQHTYDLYNYPLSLKAGMKRYIKILGYYA